MLDAENLKIKIKTKAHENNLEPQDIMQMYFFERLLYRISKSKYKNNFILKGGLLLSAIFGDERRTTQDMDTMIKGLPLDTKELENIINGIINIDCEDHISFKIKNTKEIRLIDKYGGLKVNLIGFKEHLQVPLSIDITVGDPITPRELKFKYKCMFEDSYINIMAFNKETIIAEKFETFITDNIMNTRTKDFYDLYILLTRFYDELNKDTLVKAIKNTFKRRETNYDVEKIVKTFNLIKESDKLKQNFKNYKNKKSYVENIDYDAVMDSINLVIKLLEQELVGI
ncbi:MAG: nucleotidyl transferase AbiEii/AbiGii toxin family protein [Bacilli bacterium]|nr:nucleotidyl transferase AbiEii/AbiGii toxin family protein [Bacilli bacterium]